MIRVLVQACHGALALPAEYLFEFLDFCRQHCVRWVAHDTHGAFIKANDYRSVVQEQARDFAKSSGPSSA